MSENCGAQWHKWDLHLHSCYTYVNNGFPHDNTGSVIEEEFINTLIKSGIKAVGLTNYFKFCEEDYNLKKKLNSLGIKTFLNLEIRLDHLNHDEQNFDYHIIFDDNLDDQIIKTFLTNMDAEIGCTSKKLIQLANKEIEKSAQLNFGKLIKKLEEESSGLKGRYLLGFLSRGHGNARCSGRDATNYETITRKSNLVIHSSDKRKNVIEDRRYWLDEHSDIRCPYIRPVLLGSDAHNLEKIGKKYSWIKADLTFDGLKQIVFEPEDRISLEIDYPNKKNDYQVIDKVVFNQNNKNNISVESIVLLNPNLNTVIGGRSNGKSTLTNSIARALNNNNFEERDEKKGSGMFTFKNMSEVRVIWKDGQINRGEEEQRDVEFLPQDYMIRIAESNELRNKLIEDTVKADVENYLKITEFDLAIQTIQDNVDCLVREWSTLKNELSMLVPPEGDRKGIEAQIKKLKVQISEQQKKNNFSSEDNKNFELVQNKRKMAQDIRNQAKSDSTALIKLKKQSINLKIDFSEVSKEIHEQIQAFIEEQQEKLNLLWQSKILEICEGQNLLITSKSKEIDEIENSLAYKNGKENILSNETLSNLTKLVKEETRKLDQFSKFEENKERLVAQIQKKEAEIIAEYSGFKILRNKLTTDFIVKANLVEIKLDFNPIKFEDKIDYLHSRSNVNNLFIQEFDDNSDDKISSIFDELNLSYNRGKNQIDLIKDVINQQWFKRNYTLKFDNDNFLQMSQGKKAFVILTLILEFSKDKKPVIIDQPEDSLDNRAIYIELTKYLKAKKRDRQIILVTHNPNVVVGADAENVIVANQHSAVSPNLEEIQFAYINGSLENSLENCTSSEFLNRRGIREHVIEILEGGDEAFKKREDKYDLT